MRVLVWMLGVVLLAGCQVQSGMDSRPSSRAWSSEEKGEVVALDDVTNGLMNDPAGTRSAGAFFNDGGAEDSSRGFGFTSFGASRWADTDDDGLPDTRVPPEDASGGAPPKRKQRMLIYSGQVRVEVARAEDASKEFLAATEAWGGYLQKQSGTTLTLRLPAKHFDDAFAMARGAGRVLAESREASDVTEEFVDLGIRVDNARRSRDRLVEILKRAEKVEDILRVEKELRRLTEEIERMEGRLKFLRDQVAMATLRVQFQSVAEAPPVKRSRQYSRFRWVNRVGVGAIMEGF